MFEIFITSLRQLSTTVLFVIKKKKKKKKLKKEIMNINHEDGRKGLMAKNQI